MIDKIEILGLHFLASAFDIGSYLMPEYVRPNIRKIKRNGKFLFTLSESDSCFDKFIAVSWQSNFSSVLIQITHTQLLFDTSFKLFARDLFEFD